MGTLRVRVAALATTAMILSTTLGAGGAAAAAPGRCRPTSTRRTSRRGRRTRSTTIAQQSGVRYFTLAFLETTVEDLLHARLGRRQAQPVSGGRYLSDIASLRAAGGDVIPSLGGWSADQGGTEIGDSCKDVNAIVAAYEALVTKYGVTRIDMDIEGRSLTKTDGIDRRNKAIKLLQDWATREWPAAARSRTRCRRRATGLEASGLAVLQNAMANGVRIDFVKPMVFDYYDRTTTDMGQAAINALNGLHAQLATLLPAKTDAQLWAMEGATIMNGHRRLPEEDRGHDARRRPAAAGLRDQRTGWRPSRCGRSSATTATARATPARTTAPGSSRTPGTSATS